jgi:hypothetical protein
MSRLEGIGLSLVVVGSAQSFPAWSTRRSMEAGSGSSRSWPA